MNPQRRIQISVAALIAIVAVGAAGYVIIEDYSYLDGLYMTIITITTVGFGEVTPLSRWGHIFTMILIITGFIGLSFFAHSFIEAMLERTLSGSAEKRKMKRRIAKLQGHQIICGFGRVGMAAAEEFRREGCEFVVIESHPKGLEELERRGYIHIQGDAVSEEILIDAGLERAKGLLAILPSDADNLFVILSAREINPSIRTVVRVEDASSCKKLLRAGADRVISPFTAAGVELARDLIQPRSDEDSANDMEADHTSWVAMANHPDFVGKPIGELASSHHGEVIGLRRGDKDILCPNPKMHAQIGDQVLILEHVACHGSGSDDGNGGARDHIARVCVAIESSRAAAHLARSLRRVGCLPLIAKSGRGALSVINSEKPDVALIDQGFADLPGDEVIRRIRSNGDDGSVRLVLLTESDECQTEVDVDARLTIGCDDEEVVRTIFSLLD